MIDNIYSLIHYQYNKAPYSIALLGLNRPPLTYKNLLAQINYVAKHLKTLGISSKDRIALVVPNGPEMGVAFLAIASVATCAPLNPAYKTEEVEFYLADLKPQALIVDPKVGDIAIKVAIQQNIPIIELYPTLDAEAGIFSVSSKHLNLPLTDSSPIFAQAEDIALVLHTSGTTSKPKIVPLTHKNLCISAQNIQKTLELQESDRALNIMPLFHIHGLVGVLLSSLTAGASVACSPGFVAPEFFEWLVLFEPTWYSAVPTMHQGILKQAEVKGHHRSFSSLRLVRSSSSSLAPRVMVALEKLFQAPVIEAYGMTEASHQMTSNPLPPKERKAGSVGIAAGPEVAIMNDLGALLPVGETGEVVIKGVNVTKGYDNNSTAAEAAFNDGWFRTGDIGYFDEDGYLFLKGRIKEIINRGGEKISPREVDEILLDHPAIAQAVTFAAPHILLGEDVAAAVVLKDHSSATETEIKEFAAERLADFKVPSLILFLTEIPKGATGKIQRIGLAARLGISDLASKTLTFKDYFPPTTPLETQLVEIWKDVLKFDSISINDNFLHLNGDSILAGLILNRIKEVIGVEVSFINFLENATIQDLAVKISKLKQPLEDLTRKATQTPFNLELIRTQKNYYIEKTAQQPLSFGQQRLWFLNQLEPNSSAYNILSAYRLTGSLNVIALEQSLVEIIRRHSILRTTFVAIDGEPQQTISSNLEITLPIIDLQTLPSVPQEIKAHEIATEEAQLAFDLANELPHRFKLLRLSELKHILLFNVHHIVYDRWSDSIFCHELTTLYKAFSTKQPSPLAELPIQYADFAHMQHEYLHTEALETQLSYWKQKLGGNLPVLKLPTNYPRPPKQTYKGAYQSLNLSKNLTKELKVLSQQENVTLFITLLAVFQTLLYRYSGQEDIIIGTAFAGRNQIEIEKLIGLFVNTLPLRTDLSGNQNFQQLLSQVRQTTIEAYEHQDLPLEKLIEELKPERDLSRSPLFQVMFAFENIPCDTLELPGLIITPLEIHNGTAKFDLTLELKETSEGIKGGIEYNTDLFEAATISRMLGHFQTLLENIVANPAQRLCDLSVLTPPEEHQLLFEWNNTQTDYSNNSCIHHLFEAQVQRTPNAIALIWENEQLTYQQLNQRANQLAHYLQKLGVKAETLVGICVERSIEMVVGLLGILKAGGAYVPLDPSYPQDRLAFMLHDAQVPVLLSQGRLIEHLPDHQAHLVCLDTDWEVISQQPQANPLTTVNAENLAYVIYTSGSTGQPKGVCVIHRGVNRLIINTNYIKLQGTDRIAQASNISFDAATFEIWGALLNGAQIVVITKDVLLSPQNLAQTICEKKISILFLTTALFNQLIATNPEMFQSLRYLLFGGEPVEPKWVTAMLKLGNPPGLLHVYGPTENTTFSTWYLIEAVPEEIKTLPIGRPIANTQIYLLDQNLQPVPVGVPSELYIGGDGLARGYLNRPELTAIKFIPNPFSDQPGSCLYKTGDLARYLPDGNIEFLGRRDNQVKIRGFRIELEEIEAVVGQHPAVGESVVMAHEDEVGSKRLVAYVVPHKQSSISCPEFPSQSQLRNFLKQKLPDYMIPSAYVFLETLPLTPNGKIDRLALPAPDTLSPNLESTFVPPSTAIEQQIAQIWIQLLKIDTVGLHDNFFELGGHSLLATQIISRLRLAFNVDIPLESLFDAPTIAQLSDRLETIPRTTQDITPSESARPRTENLPLSFAQQRLWFLNQLEPNSCAYNMLSAYHLTGSLNVIALEQSLVEIIRRHSILRTTFVAIDGEPQQTISSNLKITLPIIALQTLPSVAQEIKVQEIATEDAQQPFDLAKELPHRFKLLRLSELEHILILNLHHIVYDGWSESIFFQELTTLYKAFDNKQPSPLAELPIQYADFAHGQRQRLQGEVLNSQLSYWKQKLSGNLPVLQLPTDYPRPLRQNYQGGKHSLKLTKGLTTAIKTLSQQHGVTVFMTFLGAFQTLLYRYTEQEDIIIGTPIACRNQAETEKLIGLFLNNLAIRTNLSGNPTFRQLLAQVRQVTLEAYENQDLPFEKLVEELQPKRSLSRHPIFDVMLNFINIPQTAFTLPGLSISKFSDLTPLESKFSMTLYVKEQDNQLYLKMVYQKALFSSERIKTLLEQFQYLLEQIVVAPDQPIKSYSLVTPQSRSLLPNPHIFLPTPHYEPITNLFTAWVNQTPNQPAIACGSNTWSYSQLSQSAQAIGQILVTHGIKQGEVVAVSGDRSFGLIASMLSVMTSGGVLLTLEKTLPQQRKEFMLSTAKAKILLYVGKQGLEDKWMEEFLEIISVNPNNGKVNSHKPTLKNQLFSSISVSPDHPAYIFFTSGTTGIPKGVLGCHKGLSHFLHWQRQTFELQPQDRIGQLTGLSFDVVLREIFLPLISGATLCLPETADDLTPAFIIPWLERQKISVLHTVPTLAQTWLTHLPSGVSLKTLRLLFFAGEPLPEKLVRQWRQLLPESSKIINLYGPTETTLAKCYYQTHGDIPSGVQPVGVPLPETQVLVIKENKILCGIGEPGEIVIRTPFRTLGYINNPEENQRRFVKNPWSNEEQDLLYYTGDRGRYRPDGVLEILGRLDHQVKIRGIRIELEEIETVLNQHPNIEKTIVTVREDIPDEKRLVAYIIPNQNQTLSFPELRGFLDQKLPGYMVPSAFVCLDALPLTPNGKVDRQALPAPEQTRQDLEETFIAPRDELELQLTNIWEKVLGIHPIGIRDNFFLLGGHSFLAVSLFAQIEKCFPKKLPLGTLFNSPTIEQLANVLRDYGKTASCLIPIQPYGCNPPLFFIHVLGRGLKFCHPLVRYLSPDLPIYGLNAQIIDKKFAPANRVEDLAAFYIQEMRTFQPEGPYFLAGISFGGKIAYEMAQQLHSQGQKVAFLALLDTTAPKAMQKLPILERVSFHLSKFLQVGFAYLLDKSSSKVRAKLLRFQEKFTRQWKIIYSQLALKLGIDLSNEMQDLIFQQENFQASIKYVPQVYSGSVTLFCAKDRKIGQSYSLDPKLGWGDFVRGSLEIHEIPGDHLGMLQEPNVQILAEKLQACISTFDVETHPNPLGESFGS